MIEKKKSHKPLPKQYTLTICQSDLDIVGVGHIAAGQSGAGVARWGQEVRRPVSDGEDAESVGFDTRY